MYCQSLVFLCWSFNVNTVFKIYEYMYSGPPQQRPPLWHSKIVLCGMLCMLAAQKGAVLVEGLSLYRGSSVDLGGPVYNIMTLTFIPMWHSSLGGVAQKTMHSSAKFVIADIEPRMVLCLFAKLTCYQT